MNYDFDERLAFSHSQRERTDEKTIMKMLRGCVSVETTEIEENRKGIDYIATLGGGAKIGIDAKARDAGCSKYWKYDEPEFALEVWSVKPRGLFNTPPEQAKKGWTLDDAKETEYILFTFDPKDSIDAYLLPFQLLRVALLDNGRNWWNIYRHETQTSFRGPSGWESECLFVPASTVTYAIYEVSKTQIAPCTKP